ncbi:uncharacterized protein [Diadema setosum]|uniref:uncharacterized protein n=1 Tax=Diadema setosum TaxID=31175 RepID=UPI003B3AACA4
MRKRECNNPPQAGLGRDCEGKRNETRSCRVDTVCPIDGKWTAWGPFKYCSKECGGGRGYHNRTCIPPRNGGKPCRGITEEYDAACNTEPCPGATLPPELANSLKEQLQASNENYVEEPGSKVRMDCTAGIALIHAEFPEARIEWRRNGQHVAIDGARIAVDSGRLVFEAVKSGDNGVYTCQAETGGITGVVLAVFSLAVPPEAPDTQAYEAEGLEIPCHGEQLGLLFDGFVTQWYKGDRLIKSYEDVEPEEVNVEHFKNIDKRYEGVYKCIVIHQASQRRWVTNIAQVEVLPERAMHQRLMTMVKSKIPLSLPMLKLNQKNTLMVAGGVGGGLVVVLLLCCVCVCCCSENEDDEKERYMDKEANRPSANGRTQSSVKSGGYPGYGKQRPVPGSLQPLSGSNPRKQPLQPVTRPPPRPAGSAQPSIKSAKMPPPGIKHPIKGLGDVQLKDSRKKNAPSRKPPMTVPAKGGKKSSSPKKGSRQPKTKTSSKKQKATRK